MVGPILAIVRQALRIFSARGARFLGAAVAFYALMSAAPLFIVVLHVVGALFGRARAEDALFSGLAAWVAPEGVATARQLTDRLERLESRGGVVGIVLVVYGSTRLFRALRRALNQLWGVDLEAVEGARARSAKYGVRYGGAFALTLFVAVIVGLLVVGKTFIAALATFGAAPPARVVLAFDATVSVGLAFVLFTVLFRFMPETRVTLRQAAVSAAVSTPLFAIGSGLVTLYVRHKHIGDLYDGANALVLALFWTYYSAQIFFFGAAVGAALHERSRAHT